MDDQFISTIEPFENDPINWWRNVPIEDRMKLKPDTGNDILLIVGDGHNVLDDLERFLQFKQPFDLMTMNYSHKIIPKSWPVHHYISGDSHNADMQLQAEKVKEKYPDVIRHCWNAGSKNFDVRWARNSSKGWTGTTTNLGVKIGIALDYLKIVLCGCPMDDQGNWYKSLVPLDDIKRGKDHTAHLWKWTEIASRPIGHFIRSMSGNTAHLLGEPTQEWLNDIPA